MDAKNQSHQIRPKRSVRFLGAVFKGTGPRSDHGYSDRDGNSLILVDGGSSKAAASIGQAMLIATRMSLSLPSTGGNLNTRFTEQVPRIKPALQKAVQEGLSAGKAEAVRLRASFRNASITVVVVLADIAVVARYGSSRSYLRDSTKKTITVLSVDSADESIDIKEIRLTSGDLILLCTDGFWQENPSLVPILTADPKRIVEALKAFKRHPAAVDRSAFVLWLDYPWHAAAKMGFGTSAEAIAACPIFRGLPFNSICELLQIAKLRQLPANHLIVTEGDFAKSLFVLVSGSLSVFSASGYSRVRSEIGDLVGELAFLDGGTRSASVRVASTNCELIEFNNDDLEHYLNKHPDIGMKVLKALGSVASERTRETSSGGIRRPNVVPSGRRPK